MGATVPIVASFIFGSVAAQALAPSINMPQTPPPAPAGNPKPEVDKVQNQRKKQQQQATGNAGTVKTSPLGVPNINAGDGKTLLGY